METIFLIVLFIISLAALVKGADWLLSSSEIIGLAAGLSPFVIGVTIVAAGTSLPELVSSIAAVLRGVTEIVPANAIGSNVANILLVVGISAVVGRRLTVTKNLIDLDLPLLAITTVLLLGVVWDRQITYFEAILLLVTYSVYVAYTIVHKDDERAADDTASAKQSDVAAAQGSDASNPSERPRLTPRHIALLAVGIGALIFGAQYLIESVIRLSEVFHIGAGVIAITAVAVGTSLPELLVSAKAALQKKSEVALGNIFGSNVFNALVVIGVPGVIRALELDEQTYAIGVPAMALATLLFIISGISRRIHIWEGAFYLSVYVLFVAKLFNLF